MNDLSGLSMPNWNIELLRSIEWKKFERFCAAYFQVRNFITEISPPAIDGGIDIYCYKRGLNTVYSAVQCKRYSNSVIDVSEIKKFLGAIVSKELNLGYFITTSEFSVESERFVKTLKNHKIILIDAKKFCILLKSLSLDKQLPLFSLLNFDILEGRDQVCKRCGSPMLIRTNHKNGSQFLGCSAYKITGCDYKISIS